MFYFIHVLAGAVIAKFFPEVLLIIVLSLLSHFIIDIIPHRDNLFKIKSSIHSYNIKITKKAVAFETGDVVISLILMLIIFFKFQSILMMLGIFMSLLPDLIKLNHFLFKKNKIFIKYLYFHSAIQREIGWVPGLLTQLAITLLLIALLI